MEHNTKNIEQESAEMTRQAWDALLKDIKADEKRQEESDEE